MSNESNEAKAMISCHCTHIHGKICTLVSLCAWIIFHFNHFQGAWSQFQPFQQDLRTKKNVTVHNSLIHRPQSTVADKTREEETTPSDEITEYPKALKVNGQYVLPWMRSWQLPSLLVAAKWFLRTQNNSSLPGGKLKDLYQYDSKVRLTF